MNMIFFDFFICSPLKKGHFSIGQPIQDKFAIKIVELLLLLCLLSHLPTNMADHSDDSLVYLV